MVGQVVKLDLQHNELSTIPRCILELPSLSELILQHNKLTEIPSVAEWSSCLTVLDLSYNRLSSLPTHVVANSIRTLNLNDNYFRTVPLCVCSLVTLHSLDISNNPDILTLPAEMGRLSNLARLNLRGLKDLNDPPRTIQRDTRSCIIYLRGKLRCAKGYFRMKLMLVGKQNRGKTTLVARLQGKDCGNQSTVGVDVSEWENRPSLGKRPFYFSIWDFGGQEEYYTTHQCFLSFRSLYLLLFNLKDGDTGVEELKPWLNNISLRVPGSCVIIVGTHLDEVPDDERENIDNLLQKVGKLAMQYKKLKVSEVIAVGLKNRLENIALLKNAIYNTAAAYTMKGGELVMGQKIPASYHTLDKHMADIQHEVRANVREPVMHVEEFKTMVYKMNLGDIQDEEEVKAVTLFLTNVGSLLHYDDRGHNLHELYFIDPRWLCDMMSKVITIKERNPFVHRGILHSKYVPLLFKDDRFPWHYFEQYLALLDRFEIALPLDNKRILIPSMLPQKRPDVTEKMCLSDKGDPCFTRYITFAAAVTPPGFWSRLLSRVMHLVPQVRNALNKQFGEEEVEEDAELDSISSPVFTPTVSELGADDVTSISSPVSISFATKSLGMAPLELPNFPSALPFANVEDLPDASEVKLLYWRTGLYYKDPNLLFLVESLASSPLCKGRKDGVLVIASPTNTGKKVIGQLVDMVLQLVEEWYPGLQDSGHVFGSGLVQAVPCTECMKQGVADPYEFPVEDCLARIAANKVSIECRYHRDDPSKCHEVSLAEIVPDMLLQDIDAEFLLKASDVLYDDDRSSQIGEGGYGKVYRGRCKSKSVAIKKYLTRSEEAFIELRREATLLHKHHHPCLVCLVGVCVHPSTMLVLELAPMGSLERPLIKKKQVVHRVTVHRIAAQVAAALQFLHSNGIIFRDLKAANVLLWTLDPASLCHCKVADFGIAAHLGPVGARSLHGTKGFIAPEVLHIGKRKENSVYNHMADIFSYGMFLYQMIARRHPFHDVPPVRIDSAVENGDRPRLQDVPQATCGFFYLTRLMQECWHDNPSKRVTTEEIIRLTSLTSLQSVVSVVPVLSKFSLRHACAITPTDFAKCGLQRNSSELWVCCDGAEGAEINVFTANTMVKVNKNFIKENQVQCMALCGDHIWVGSRAGIEYGVIDIFGMESRDLIHNIRMKENAVSCITCSATTVYCGTLEGYCFAFSKNIKMMQAQKTKPMYKYVSEHAVDGITATRNQLWISHTRYIYFLNLENLMLEGSTHRHTRLDAFVGQLSLDASGTTVWSAHLGGTIVSAWNVLHRKHNWDVDVLESLRRIEGECSEQDAVVTAMTPVLDTVWVGVTSGYILVFHEERLLTWHRPYTQYIRFLEAICSEGPSQSEACMVACGAKEFNTSMIQTLRDYDTLDEKGRKTDQSGAVVLWEAFPAKVLEQVKLVEENSSDYLSNHHNLRRIVRQGDFKDGTHLLQKEAEKGVERGDSISMDMADSESFDSLHSLVMSPKTDGRRSDGRRSDGILSLVTQGSCNSQLPATEEEEEEEEVVVPNIMRPRNRSGTMLHETVDVQLPDKSSVRLACPKPLQLKVLLSELQVNANLPEEHCRVEYCESDSGERVKMTKQSHLEAYLRLPDRPALFLSKVQ